MIDAVILLQCSNLVIIKRCSIAGHIVRLCRLTLVYDDEEVLDRGVLHESPLCRLTLVYDDEEVLIVHGLSVLLGLEVLGVQDLI